MKAGLSMLLLMAAFAAPAYAGHGTIEETDEVIIVEYSGDTGDNQPAKKGEASVPSRPVAPAQAGVTHATDALNPANAVNTVKAEGDSDRARPQKDEAAAAARRQAREEKRARKDRLRGGSAEE